MARLTNDLRLAAGEFIRTRLPAALDQPHKIYHGEPYPLQQEPAGRR